MSYADPVHWRGRADELRAAAEPMNESVSKQMMLRMAEDYERLAQIAEQRAKECPSHPAFAIVAVPRAVRHFARKLLIPSRPDAPGVEIPRFLKRGPATAEDVGAPVDGGAEILMRIAPESRLALVAPGEVAVAEPER